MSALVQRAFSPLIALLLLLVVGRNVVAQDIPTFQLLSDPKYQGVRSGSVQGYAGYAGQLFSVSDLAASQPIILYISESTFGRRVRVDLAKFDDFLVPFRTCQTTPTEPCLIETRTDGDLFIRIKSLDQTLAEYLAILWVGSESKTELPSLFTPSRGASVKSNPTARPSVPETDPDQSAGTEQMTARFFAYDARRKLLVVADAVGTKFEFVLPDDATMTVSGDRVRVGEYIQAHFSNLPYAANQQLRLIWKPSTNGLGRVVVAVR